MCPVHAGYRVCSRSCVCDSPSKMIRLITLVIGVDVSHRVTITCLLKPQGTSHCHRMGRRICRWHRDILPHTVQIIHDRERRKTARHDCPRRCVELRDTLGDGSHYPCQAPCTSRTRYSVCWPLKGTSIILNRLLSLMNLGNIMTLLVNLDLCLQIFNLLTFQFVLRQFAPVRCHT